MSDLCQLTQFVRPYFFIPTYMTAFFIRMLGQFRLPHQTLPVAVGTTARTASGQAVAPEQHLPQSQTILHTDSRPACSFPQIATVSILTNSCTYLLKNTLKSHKILSLCDFNVFFNKYVHELVTTETRGERVLCDFNVFF